MSVERARSEHTSPPTRGGEACRRMSAEPGQSLRTVERPVQALGVEARRTGVTRSVLAGCISYDGGRRAPSTDIASPFPHLH
jgi:hypothetical protein